MFATAMSSQVSIISAFVRIGCPIVFVLMFLFLLVGCGESTKQNPAKLYEVNGAYGWNLGDVLPSSFQVKTNDGALDNGITYEFEPAKIMDGAKPQYCFLVLTEDRRIAAIYSMGSDGLFNEFSIKNILESKYGMRKAIDLAYDLHKYYFGTTNRQAVMHTSSADNKTTVFLDYRDEQLCELARIQKENRQSAKFQQMQNSLKGNL